MFIDLKDVSCRLWTNCAFEFYLTNDSISYASSIFGIHPPVMPLGIDLRDVSYGPSTDNLVVCKVDILATATNPPTDPPDSWPLYTCTGAYQGRYNYTTRYTEASGCWPLGDTKKTDLRWADLPYAKVPGATFRVHGSLLCCYINVLNKFLVNNGSVTPPVLNDWLKTQTDGYIGLVPNALAVLRWASQAAETPRKLKYDQKLTKDVALFANRGIVQSVMNGNDWVTISGYTITPGGVRHRLHDPDGTRNKFLEDFTGVPRQVFAVSRNLSPSGIASASESNPANFQVACFSEADICLDEPDSEPATAVYVQSFPAVIKNPTSSPVTFYVYDGDYNLIALHSSNDSTIEISRWITTVRVSPTETYVESPSRVPAYKLSNVSAVQGQVAFRFNTDYKFSTYVGSMPEPLATNIESLPSMHGILARVAIPQSDGSVVVKDGVEDNGVFYEVEY